MNNKVVYRVAKTMRSFALPVLRFNFRGVGMSAGAYDRGIGEGDDVAAALDWLAREFPGVPLLAAGFSFGAWVGMRVGCADPRVAELIGLGLPVNDSSLDFTYLRNCSKPKLLLIGERDEYASRQKVEALMASFPEEVAANARIAFVPRADHFFTGHLEEMTRQLAIWLRERHPELRQGDF